MPAPSGTGLTGSLTVLGQTFAVPCGNAGAAVIAIDGGIVSLQIDNGSGLWPAAFGVQVPTGAPGLSQSTSTLIGPGTWVVNTAGYVQFRCLLLGGTANVTISLGTAPAPNNAVAVATSDNAADLPALARRLIWEVQELRRVQCEATEQLFRTHPDDGE